MPENDEESLSKLLTELEQLLPTLVPKIADRLWPLFLEKLQTDKPWKKNIFVPDAEVYALTPESDFMSFSTCAARDFFHPEFKRIREVMKVPSIFHRKYWEWVFIFHHISRGLDLSGKRGLGFGVGSHEPLTAAFAKHGAYVTATDAPESIGVAAGWASGGEFASSVDSLSCEGIMERSEFGRQVSFREVDMNDIPSDLTGYDFCWSSCCLEHLGDLDKGLAFIINSVERTLKVGGIACHTTEFNLSSNEQTLETGPSVLYRLKDIEALSRELRTRGHEVLEFRVAPDSVVVDGYVDTPPYSAPPHLKLDLSGFTSTSAGIVVRRGR
jgi:SAM-dependent methyltransferase